MVKMNKMLATIFTVITLVSSTTVFAAGINNMSATSISTSTPIEDKIISIIKTKNKQEMTDKQKSEKKAAYEAAKAKWDSLSTEQKNEIYRLKDISIDAEQQIIEKYLEYGIMDKETAENIKAKMNEHKDYMRKNSEMPFHRFKIKIKK